MEVENEGPKDKSYSQPQLTDEQRWAIIIAHKYFSLKQSDICNKFEFATKGNVCKIIKKYNETGSIQNRPKSGRPSLSSTSNVKENIQNILADTNMEHDEKKVQINDDSLQIQRKLINQLRNIKRNANNNMV
ncbi:hypothetical protein ABPG72_012093 [Tetrahymena utriculariae]